MLSYRPCIRQRRPNCYKSRNIIYVRCAQFCSSRRNAYLLGLHVSENLCCRCRGDFVGRFPLKDKRCREPDWLKSPLPGVNGCLGHRRSAIAHQGLSIFHTLAPIEDNNRAALQLQRSFRRDCNLSRMKLQAQLSKTHHIR